MRVALSGQRERAAIGAIAVAFSLAAFAAGFIGDSIFVVVLASLPFVCLSIWPRRPSLGAGLTALILMVTIVVCLGVWCWLAYTFQQDIDSF